MPKVTLTKSQTPLILALDIGSSSVRAALYDDDANLIPRTSVKIAQTFTATPDGGSEMRTGKAIGNVIAAVDAVLEKTKRLKGEIVAVATCAFWHSLVGIDVKGNHTPVVLGWADTRSRQYTTILKATFNESEVHNRTGAHFHSSYWPAKLLWLRRESPDVWDRTTQWLSFSDYVALRMFGAAVTSVSMASATGIFDQRQCVWDGELLKYLKLSRAKLPTIAESDEQTFQLNSKFARRWPRLANAKWFPTIGDGAADNIGSGCATKNKAALMVGTSAAMRVAYTGEPPKQIPDGLWCYRIDRRRVIVGGALSDGGNLYQLIKTRFKLSPNTGALIRRRGSVPDDLIVLPFFFGERSTGYNEDATGAIIGLKPTHDGIDILHAAMEGVAFRLAEIYKRLKKVAGLREIVASGGALHASPVWTQIIADVLGHDLTVTDTEESASRGAVLLALQLTGKIEGTADSD
ncbi:MAG: gluconokinase [Pyrinomonadaceae bacterium]